MRIGLASNHFNVAKLSLLAGELTEGERFLRSYLAFKLALQ